MTSAFFMPIVKRNLAIGCYTSRFQLFSLRMQSGGAFPAGLYLFIILSNLILIAMTLYRNLLILLSLFLTTSFVYSKDKIVKNVYVDAQGKTMPYCLILPDNYNPKKQYPLILFLHGGGERGTDNQSQLKYVSDLFMDKKFRKDMPCLILLPQCPDGEYWVEVDRINWEFPDKTTQAEKLNSVVGLVGTFVENKKVKSDEIYALGMSMGGMAVLSLVRDYPDLLKSAISICGATNIEALKNAEIKTPVWLLHGDSDPVVPAYFSREAYAVLKDKNENCRYTEYQKTMHDSWNKAFQEPDFLYWLFE